ncbi:MAG: undecaprenyl-phosphate glucose phosphotransferase [Chloroflexi bacterium]|nr:undecaprenyl-phosphate glucose phosphotransferase [Chloroflexota bacterium]
MNKVDSVVKAQRREVVTADHPAVKRRLQFLLVILLLVLDALMVTGAFIAAYSLLQSTDIVGSVSLPPVQTYSAIIAIITLTLLVVFYFYGLYHLKRGISRIDEFYKISSAVSLGTVLAVAINSFLLADSFVYPRQMLIFGWLLSLVSITVARMSYRSLVAGLRKRGLGQAKILIVGAGHTGNTILQQVNRSPDLGYQVVGFLDDEVMETSTRTPVLGKVDHLPRVIQQYGVEEVIIAISGASHQKILDIVALCQDEAVNIKVYPDAFQIITKNEVSIGDLNGLPLVSIRDTALQGWHRIVKRLVDVVFSIIALILLSPLLLFIALLVKLDSPGPAFYVQERVGLDGKPIRILKFRSMRVDAERRTGPVFARPDDPRKTPVGRFIRRFSIDEMPQFINVVMGQMSIVGPRPERPHFVEQFRERIPSYMRRHREKAGLTGWAQINGLRGDTSIEERTRYDLYYIENWSLLFDFKIMAKTILQLFRDPQAY